MLRALRSAAARSTRAAPSLRLRRALAGSVRSGRSAILVARTPGWTRAHDVALPRVAAALLRRGANHPWRRLHPTFSRRASRVQLGSRQVVRQGRIAESDELLQS